MQRNLLTAFDETLGAMAEVEGNAWLQVQSQGRGYSVPEALHRIRTVPLYGTNPDHYSCVIYSAGGMSRWIVTGNGTVTFSKWHCHDRWTLRQVQELGFDLF